MHLHVMMGDMTPQNVPSALFGLGYMYLAGYGVALDHRKAFKYFSQAAEQARLAVAPDDF